MAKPDPRSMSDAEWRGIRSGALGNAIRERLHTLVDQLSPLQPPSENKKVRMEIVALLEQHPHN